MIRLIAILTVLGLAACSQEPIIDAQLDGKWGWEEVANCRDNHSVWVFSGNVWRIYRQGERVAMRPIQLEREDGNFITVRFVDPPHRMTRRMRFEKGGRRLRLLAGQVDGLNDPQVALFVNQVWVRCPTTYASSR